jgi:hypothetical protein
VSGVPRIDRNLSARCFFSSRVIVISRMPLGVFRMSAD